MTDERKKNIRREIIARRDALTEQQLKSMSRRICARVTRLKAVKNSALLMTFLNFGSEVITDYLIEWGWRHHKKIAVPLCKPQTREMAVYAIEKFADLVPGYFGIREPKGDTPPLPKGEIGLVIVPAVAFDRRGYRIGYGGGYYDRFLAGMSVPKIGIAFSCQIIPEAPVDRYDLAVDGIVTEEEYIKT